MFIKNKESIQYSFHIFPIFCIKIKIETLQLLRSSLYPPLSKSYERQ